MKKARGNQGAIVSKVEPDGLAARAGLTKGCVVLTVNGREIEDMIDFMFHAAEPEIELRWLDPHGAGCTAIIHREYGEFLGVDFEPFRARACRNRCPFCFIHQLPKGLRKPLYFKDEDYRLSFLYGHYITGTNLSERDFERIAEYQLSPLYISVHATEPELRKRMLGRENIEPVQKFFDFMAEHELEFHAQIVLCPGWNDGEHLLHTVRELRGYWPWLRSVAVVPVGLTDHRDKLPQLDPVTPEYARALIKTIKPIQRQYEQETGDKLIYLGDEFYLMSDTRLPSYRGRHDLPQIENGVGMVYRFMQPWKRLEKKLPPSIHPARRIGVVTGALGYKMLAPAIERLKRIGGLDVALMQSWSAIFGKEITVTGLLAGCDFVRTIREHAPCDYYLIPANALRPWDQIFLDDMTVEDLAQQAGAPIHPLGGDMQDLVEAILHAPQSAAPHHAQTVNYEKRIAMSLGQ
ncbi:DUF512 domain-containing protein [Candidatus Sumerlaeota bacterium]|nr:DUF512 domain-containing protein [Candidatus Sumerlaeota bacterium]